MGGQVTNQEKVKGKKRKMYESRADGKEVKKRRAGKITEGSFAQKKEKTEGWGGEVVYNHGKGAVHQRRN